MICSVIKTLIVSHCTAVTAAVTVPPPELLHGHFFLLKPLKSNFLQFIEEAWTGQCVECKVPRELFLHTDQLMPPLEIGENWIREVWGERNGPCRRRQKDKGRKRGGSERGAAAAGVTDTVQLLLWVFWCTVLHSTMYRCAECHDEYFY